MQELLARSCHVLKELSKLIESQVDQCTYRINTLNSMFSVLPDELFSVVLEYAAYSPKASPSQGDRTFAIIRSVKNAMKLSSVCSHFRRVALSSPNLWNRVCSGMSAKMFETCFDRARTSGLDAILEIITNSARERGPEDEAMTSFLVLVASAEGNLSRFDHRCFPDRNFFTSTSFPEAKAGELEVITRNLNAPRLRELNVEYIIGADEIFREGRQRGDSDSHWLSKLHFYSTWTLPALRCMSVTNIIPISFTGSSFIETLSISLDYRASGDSRDLQKSFDANAFLSFLSTCKALKRLVVLLDSAKMSEDTTMTDRAKMPNIEEFDLKVISCCYRTVSYLMESIPFAHVAKMGLAIECNTIKHHIIESHMDGILKAIFPSSHAFPILKTLRFSVWCECQRPFSRFEPSTLNPIPVTVPVDKLPKLDTLHLHRMRNAKLLLDNGIPRSLRNIFVEPGCWSVVESWIGRLLRSLRARGKLDAKFSQITITTIVFRRRLHGYVTDALTHEELENLIALE